MSVLKTEIPLPPVRKLVVPLVLVLRFSTNFLQEPARRFYLSRFLQAVGWNVPILLAVFGYWGGFGSVQGRLLMEPTGLHWGVINEQTVRAQTMMIWTSEHLLVLLAFAIFYNSVYLVRPVKRALRCVRLGLLITLAGFCLWYFAQGFYLCGKLYTM